MDVRMGPVRIGLFLGLLCIFFGIFWAMYLTLRHDEIHAELMSDAVRFLEEKFIITPPAPEGETPHSGHTMEHGEGMAPRTHGHGADPLVEAAHKRLLMGHLHAMGLGLLTITLSILLALMDVSDRAKIIASAFTGTGSLFYPLTWIIMGHRTPVLGLDEAAVSVRTLVFPSLLLVLTGLLLTLFFLFKTTFLKSS